MKRVGDDRKQKSSTRAYWLDVLPNSQNWHLKKRMAVRKENINFELVTERVQVTWSNRVRDNTNVISVHFIVISQSWKKIKLKTLHELFAIVFRIPKHSAFSNKACPLIMTHTWNMSLLCVGWNKTNKQKQWAHNVKRLNSKSTLENKNSIVSVLWKFSIMNSPQKF